MQIGPKECILPAGDTSAEIVATRRIMERSKVLISDRKKGEHFGEMSSSLQSNILHIVHHALKTLARRVGISCHTNRSGRNIAVGPVDTLHLFRSDMYVHWQMMPTVHGSFRSVAVITCASHAQGPRFEPGREHFLFVPS